MNVLIILYELLSVNNIKITMNESLSLTAQHFPFLLPVNHSGAKIMIHENAGRFKKRIYFWKQTNNITLKSQTTSITFSIRLAKIINEIAIRKKCQLKN